MGVSDDDRLIWYRHWVRQGLEGLEGLLTGNSQTGDFCHGDHPGLAGLCLGPQLYNARRFEVDLTPYLTLLRIDQACRSIQAFAAASPELQPDAPAKI